MEKNFRLESILKLREHVLNRERDKLINLNNIKDELLDKKTIIKRTIEDNINELEIYKRKGQFEFISIYENYIYNLNEKIDELERNLVKLNLEIDKQMRIVFEARKEKKIIEKLKENHKLNYDEYQKHVEEKFVDEVNTIKYNDKKI
jgi:flagellar FliJ protein